MNERNWLILTALAMEAKAVRSEFRQGLPEGVNLEVIGIGGKRVDRGSFGAGVKGIILAGLGGALDPGLRVGDVVVEGVANEIDGARIGRIYSADRLIATVAEKRRLFEESGSLAVDMEGGLIGRICREGGIRMVHVRAISDVADEAVSPRMLGWVDDVGKPRARRVAAGLALHPGEIPAMIRLGRNSKIALKNMARIVRRIVEGEMGS